MTSNAFSRRDVRMSREMRLALLLAERQAFGRPFVFTCSSAQGSNSMFATVHVVGPDEDQPETTDPDDVTLNNAVRAVCGTNVFRMPGHSRYIGVFERARICGNCIGCFGTRITLLWHDNTPEVQANALRILAEIRGED